MVLMIFTVMSLKISQNDYYGQSLTARNDCHRNFNIAFSLRDNSGLYGPQLNSDLRLIAY